MSLVVTMTTVTSVFVAMATFALLIYDDISISLLQWHRGMWWPVCWSIFPIWYQCTHWEKKLLCETMWFMWPLPTIPSYSAALWPEVNRGFTYLIRGVHTYICNRILWGTFPGEAGTCMAWWHWPSWDMVWPCVCTIFSYVCVLHLAILQWVTRWGPRK